IHQLVPEQQLQLANIQRFTPSCCRCRQKKLKCDTNLPCNQCIAKGVDDECRKDPRVPRGRKRPKPDTITGPSINSTHNESSSRSNRSNGSASAEDEIAALKRRVKELEALVSRSARAPRSSRSPPPSGAATGSARISFSSSKQSETASSHDLGTSSRGSQTTGPSEAGRSGSHGRLSPTSLSVDTDNEDDEDAVDETEETLKTLERLAASDPRVGEPGHGRSNTKQINIVRPLQIAPDGPNAYYSGPSTLQERIDMLITAKRLMPDKLVLDGLVYAFNIRCHSLVGRIIHMPTFQRDTDFFASASIEDIITSPLNMYDLARLLMVLRLGMRFYPWKGGLFVDPTTPEFIAINALKNRGDDISHKWRDLAKRALAADRVFSLGSFKAIQTALLMILDGRDSATYLRMLLRISIQTALDMGLHRLGNAMPTARNPDEDIVRLETGVRIWWYLVVKDWCSAQREGAYTVHPSQMTTRRPLHTNDERLSRGLIDEVPHDEHCETSYTLAQIQLANIIRESIDLRNEQSTLGGSYDVISPTNRKLLQVELESFLSEDLPPFYRLDSTAMKPGVLAVQRCLLHQQTFDVLLKLNRKSLAGYSERATCTLLAEQIVSTQKLLRSVCPVIDGFWVNFLHLFGATLTLTISLLLDRDLDDETRARRRSKVSMALETMRETPGSDRGSLIIENLLREEERLWTSSSAVSPGMDRARLLDLPALTRRIVAQTSELSNGTAAEDVGSDSNAGAAHGFGIGIGIALGDGLVSSLYDVTPDESVVPVFASSWNVGNVDLSTDPCDPLGLLSVPAPSEPRTTNTDQPIPQYTPRPYEYCLRPWQEPSPS
ncbi:hypothetical protein BCV70DRAFT_149227, partial [Testicularia cyperi]